jgi:hypothetical protein
MFGSGPGSNDSNQTLYRTFRVFRAIPFFPKEKVCVAAIVSCSSHSRGPENKPHRLHFLGDSRSCPFPETDNTLQTWHPVSLYRSSNARTTRDF